MRFSLATLMLISLLSLPVHGQGNAQTLPNSPKGFDKQYKRVFKAYEKGDEKELLEGFRTFAIPERWFADEFGPEEGPKLSRQYLYRFRDFETDTVQEFNRVTCDYDAGCNRGQIKTRAAKATELAQAPPASTSLLSMPPVRRFRIEHLSILDFANLCLSTVDIHTDPTGSCSMAYSTATGELYDNSWMSSFVYLDGAFRFVGSGTCPFWDSCAAKQPLPESELDEPPEPVHFNLRQKSKSRDLLAWMAKLLGKNH